MANQKEYGVVYTLHWLTSLILNESGFDSSYGKIIDTACGEGTSLVESVKKILSKGNTRNLRKQLEPRVFGIDIDDTAVRRCKSGYPQLRRGVFHVDWNIFCADALDIDVSKWLFGQFDFVVGKPPYVRIQNSGEQLRKQLQRGWYFCASGSTNIYIAFFGLAFRLLKNGRKLGYIMPNTWLKTQTAHAWRQSLMIQKPVIKLIDFEH